ncbi:MAG: LicD family protein [Candidatus Fimisoma sp.]
MNAEQKLLLDLLLKLNDFFSKNEITYYLDGGTAIGALRHNGFLPWDDDADIYVTRENYEKLLKVADQLDEIGIVLGCYELHKEYSKTAAKFTDLNDTSFVKSDAFHGLAMGQNIDIFVLDPVPEDKIEEYYDYFNAYSELLTYNYLVNENILNHMNVFKKYENLMKKEGRHKVLDELLKKFTAYSEEESEYYALRWGQIPMVYRKDIFGKPRMLNFEGHMLPVPEKVEDFLRTQFGDGWKYVPETENQITHNIYVNHDVCGVNYYEDFKHFVDLQSAEKNLTERKKYWIKRLPQKLATEKEKNKLFDLSIGQIIEDTWKENSGDALFEKKQYSSLLRILDDVEKQGRRFSDGRKVYMSHKDIIDKIIYVWAMGGKHFVAYKYIKSMNITEEDGELAKIYIKATEINHNLYVLMENRRYDEAETIIDNNFECFSENIEFYRCKAQLLVSDDNPQLQEAEKLCDNGLKLYEDDGELLKIKGDIETLRGNNENAIALYEKAVKNTRNGLIWLELKNKYGIEAEL